MTPVALCALALVDTTLSVDGDGIVERTELQVEAPCPHVTFELPAQASVLATRGKGKLSDDTKRKLRAERWRTSPMGADGSRQLTVFLGDLFPGDRADLSITRRWASDRFVFDPRGAQRARLRVPPSVRTSVPTERGLVEGGPELGVVEVLLSDAPDRGFEVPHPAGPPAGDVTHDRRVTLIVPEGDAQRLLFPGGGSSVKYEDFFTFPASSVARSLPVPIPSSVEVSFHVEPESAAAMRRGPEGVLIDVQAWEGPVRVALVHTMPDAPTYGERPVGVDEYTVDAPGGEIAWQEEAWHLVRMGRRPILPDEASLLKALDHRFRQAALPEPGLPQELRGRTRTWDLAADLRPALFQRVRPGLPGDPLWPRKLVKARKSGLLTDTEAMLTLWLYGRQAGLRTDWALVRPAHLGPIDRAVPSGFTGALVRVDGGDEVRFIDAACMVCAPFEVRPWLEGGTTLSPAHPEGPSPTRGRSEVRHHDGVVTWDLEGPPALLLRLWLEPIAPAQRGLALAERLAGPGARILSTAGIADAGDPIQVQAVPGARPALGLDPLALPPARDDGAWASWVGDRVRSYPASGDVHDARWASDSFSYERSTADGQVVERLRIEERAIPQKAARTLAALRTGVGPSGAIPSIPDAEDP